MHPILHASSRFPIRLRLAFSLAGGIAIAGAVMLLWASHAHRQSAVGQARAFAQSVHQLTLAGLTGMMITGTSGKRSVFLEQIERSNDMRALRVVRGPAVARQYGPGTSAEQVRDPAETRVMETGQALFEVRDEGNGEYLKAVMPALASRNALGKDCIGCHAVPEGTVLGAVSLEISLDRMNADVAAFRRGLALLGLAILLPLAWLAYFAVSRNVSRPLARLAAELDAIARGQVDLGHRLPVHGRDEIATTTEAFHRVLEKAADMVSAERIAADVFENAIEGILVTDPHGTIVRVNPAFTRTTGYRADEAIGRKPKMLQSGQHDESFYKAFWHSLKTTGQWQGDIWNKRKNGEVYPEWLNIVAVRDEQGRVQNYVAIFSDITERKRHEALITYQAHHDALTGLPNRVLFTDRIEQAIAIARRKGGKVAVMFMDLDRFKMINDTLGHDAGDDLLKQVSRRLRDSVRETDTVARMGGDEFTVLLPDIPDVGAAETVAAKMLKATKQPYVLAGKELFVTSSIGVGIYPEHGRDPDTLMKHADAAMYHIKDQGRAGYCVFHPALEAHAKRHLELESQLHKALDNGELRILYQPQVSVDDGHVTGVEALLRWEHPRLGDMPSRELLPLAEESGLIVPIGEWVLRQACAQAARWAKEGRPLGVTVNLSPRQFGHDRLVDTVRDALHRTGLEPSRLELEITEGHAMQDVERTSDVLHRLSALGVRLALSEFGMGFRSSLNDLKRIPVDAIKIDRALVRDLVNDPDCYRTVATLAELGRRPDVKIMAVGVENSGQLEILRNLRCDSAQGKFLSHALLPEQVAALVKVEAASDAEA